MRVTTFVSERDERCSDGVFIVVQLYNCGAAVKVVAKTKDVGSIHSAAQRTSA